MQLPLLLTTFEYIEAICNPKNFLLNVFAWDHLFCPIKMCLKEKKWIAAQVPWWLCYECYETLLVQHWEKETAISQFSSFHHIRCWHNRTSSKLSRYCL